MKATVIEVESEKLHQFCYNHGGVKVHDSWYKDDKTTRFVTQDKKHPTSEYFSFVYICTQIGPMSWMDIISTSGKYTAATCKDEEGDECYILCENPKVGDVIEFDKLGFEPYGYNPDTNRYGRYNDYDW